MFNPILNTVFYLDYVRITLTLTKKGDIQNQLANYFSTVREAREDRTDNPIMPDDFLKRTYFRRKGFGKIYILHVKISPMQGIDALLIIHDLSILNLLDVEQILLSLPSVNDFHFTRIEFAWEFFTKQGVKPESFQRFLIQHNYLKSSRSAFHSLEKQRFGRKAHKRLRKPRDHPTYYNNSRASDSQLKCYIDPIDKASRREKRTKFEYTLGRRALEKTKPYKAIRFCRKEVRRPICSNSMVRHR